MGVGVEPDVEWRGQCPTRGAILVYRQMDIILDFTRLHIAHLALTSLYLKDGCEQARGLSG
jgi:hypothetical protein